MMRCLPQSKEPLIGSLQCRRRMEDGPNIWGHKECDSRFSKACPYTRGLNGIALLEAYRLFKKDTHLDAALKTGDNFLQNPDKPIVCIGYPSRDAAFIAGLAEVSRLDGKDGQKYLTMAKLLWRQCIKGT